MTIFINTPWLGTHHLAGFGSQALPHNAFKSSVVAKSPRQGQRHNAMRNGYRVIDIDAAPVFGVGDPSASAQ